MEKLTKSKNLDNVVLLPRQPKDAMPKIWCLCDVSLVNLRDVPLFKKVIPSKIFEAMGMGIPIILSMPKGEATEIIERAEAGIVVEPESHIELAKAILKLADNKKLRLQLAENAANSAFLYSREKLADDMASILEKVVT